jgi:transcriptional regulator with XRE-family HTH domain
VAGKADKIIIKLGSNVRKLRLAQDLSQGQLAFEAGLTREFINKLEAGKVNISVKKLQMIASALDVHISTLFH